MDRLFQFGFVALLRREVLENRNLFIWAPAVLALILFVFAAWMLSIAPEEELAAGIEYLAIAFDGLSPIDMAPLFMVPAIPFMLTLYLCALIYLLNSLYQDRKDMSVLFWQSMPVSNAQTVLSKIVTVGLVAPLFYVAILLVFYLIGVLWLALLGMGYEAQLAGLGYMFMASVVSLALVYLSALVTTLWLLPTVGWVLLFSAFAKRTPILWAAGVFFLIGFLEDFVFGSQYLANWVESRSNPGQYIIYQFSGVADRLFSYDMLFGVLVGSILVTGAIFMRRFID